MACRMAGSADENGPFDPYNMGMPARTSDRRDLRLLAGAVGLSATGDMLAMVSLSVRVHDLTGSALAVAALYATTFVPLVLLAPLAGLLADRVESVRLLAIAAVTQAAVAGGLAFSSGLPALLALSFLLAAGAAVSQPAEFSLVPVVARGRTTEANGLMESARYAGFALGPVLAGLLTAGAGTRVALLVNAGSFLAIAGAAALMRARRRPQHDEAGPGRARDGLVHLARDPVLAVTVTAAVAGLMFMSMSLTAYVFYAKDVLRVGDAGYAMLFAVWMAAMAVGATGVARRAPSHLLACGALTALAVQGAGVALQACFAVMPVALAGFAVGGLGHGIKNTLLRSLIQERVPPAVHGRAFAAYNGARNAAELGALAAGGMLVAAVGPRTALFVAGLGPVLAGTAGLTALVRPRTVPRRVLQ